jgi:rRNA maturation RNase YbeY
MNKISLEIYNETKTRINESRFLDLRNKILGKDFDLSISILDGKNSQKINRKVRKMTYVPNTLSLKYSKTSGEVILTPEVIKKETYILANKKITKFEDKLLYLTIHSMLHLTDLDHGDKMDRLEEKYFKIFKQ